jgi:hypothetical protein
VDCCGALGRDWHLAAIAAAAEIRTLLEVTFITKMRTSIPQDRLITAILEKSLLVGDHYFSSDIHRS